jgi:hypothetical protein
LFLCKQSGRAERQLRRISTCSLSLGITYTSIEQPDSLRFIRVSGILTPITPGSNNTLELLLTGGPEGQQERLTVARATTKHLTDSTKTEILTETGALGLVSYLRKTQDVVLVPVNGAKFPLPGTDFSSLLKHLNKLYAPAVVNWCKPRTQKNGHSRGFK